MSHQANDIHRVSIQRQLSAALDVARKRLARFAAMAGAGNVAKADSELRDACAVAEQIDRELAGPTPLDVLCRACGLSSFERALLLLCAGVELDHEIETLCKELQGDGAPTFSLALASLPAATWDALNPAAPLRHWHLIRLEAGSTLATRRLHIEEYILHFILGLDAMDERLMDLFEPVDSSRFITPSQRVTAERISGLWMNDPCEPIVALAGSSPTSLRAVAAHAAQRSGLRLYSVDARDLPDTCSEQIIAARLWQRHAALTSCALLIEASTDAVVDKVVAFARRLRVTLFVVTSAPLRLHGRTIARIDVDKPGYDEQRALWREALGVRANGLDQEIDAVVAQFSFDADDILTISTRMQVLAEASEGTSAREHLWAACRRQARPRLEHLARRIEPRATWDDLIMDMGSKKILRHMVSQVRQKMRVYEDWGFAARSARGLGISALFAGPSGTGKTTAAEVLARELGLELYRVDLSALVSKYIGETEKNLRQVFDGAEEGGAILLFDEADALFGKRSEVKDSHDRYANMEVSYLLQRMEAYRGLAILTTNLRDSLDSAFTRRIRFVVEFPFPLAEVRVAIWQRMFPVDAPTEGLDFAKLARLNLAGGSIRNVALGGAFLAAEEGVPILMRHLQEAARHELSKLGRPAPERDLKDWI